MRYLSRLLFSFDGRIARTDYWIALILLQVVSICVSLLIQPDYFSADATHPFVLAALSLAVMVPELAVCTKRFTDIEWPVWLGFAIVVAATAASIALDCGLTVDGSAGNLALSLTALALVLIEVIPCGFFKSPTLPVAAAIAS